jgi:hypothetical protein
MYSVMGSSRLASQSWWGSGGGGVVPASTFGNQAFEAKAALSPR